MEFEGTPEDWEDDRGEEGEEEEESLIGKAWCMVHFEEVSLFSSTVARVKVMLTSPMLSCSDSHYNVITVTLPFLLPTISQSLTPHFRPSNPPLPTHATITLYTSSAPVAEIPSSILLHTKDQEKRLPCLITFGNNTLIVRSVI